MKHYNAIRKEICQTNKVGFIDNHDSFVLASGELPYDFYHADNVNLRFPGIRKLVQNIKLVMPNTSFSKPSLFSTAKLHSYS